MNQIMNFSFTDAPQSDWHNHLEPELFFLLDGELELSVGQKTFQWQKGDFLLINFNQPHRYCHSKHVLLGILKLDYRALCRKLGTSRPYFFCNSRLERHNAYGEIRKLITQIFSQPNDGLGLPGIYLDILYNQLLFLLVNNFLVLPEDPRYRQIQDEDSERRSEITAYIDLHYQEDLKLGDLAAALYLSEAYLSKYIKKSLGCGFVRYLNGVRLTHAVEELLSGKKSITRAAIEAGFPNMSSFNRIFKETYHTTPSAYLEQHRILASPPPQMPKPDRLTGRLEHLWSQEASSSPETDGLPFKDISLDPIGQSLVPYKKVWSQMINIGPAKDLLRAKTQSHVLFLCRTLGFSQFRLWDLFSRELYLVINPKEHRYNFSKLDNILDFLTSNGMHPFLELGFKPIQIIQTLDHYVTYEEQKIVFEEPGQFSAFLQAFLSHCIRRYGIAEVEQWVIELWYDERMTVERYLDTFDLLSQTVKARAPHLRIGGAGFNVSFGTDPMADFLRSWKKRMSYPDFISIYSYQYIPYSVDPGNKKRFKSGQVRWQRSTDTHYLKNQIRMVREIMASVRFTIPEVYVTEWNSTISSRDIFNDSCYKGAYVLKNLIDTYGQASLLGYWVGSDVFSDSYDSDALLNGGGGLLSKDGICKPAYYAFSFMNRSGRYVLYHGDHCLATHDGSGTLDIACHNCKQLNFSYYATSQERFSSKMPRWEQVFDDTSSLRLVFHIRTDTTDNYRITVYSVSRKSGSALDKWLSMGQPSDLTPEDISYMERVSVPHVEIYNRKASEGVLVVDTVLTLNEIQSLHIQPCHREPDMSKYKGLTAT